MVHRYVIALVVSVAWSAAGVVASTGSPGFVERVGSERSEGVGAASAPRPSARQEAERTERAGHKPRHSRVRLWHEANRLSGKVVPRACGARRKVVAKVDSRPLGKTRTSRKGTFSIPVDLPGGGRVIVTAKPTKACAKARGQLLVPGTNPVPQTSAVPAPARVVIDSDGLFFTAVGQQRLLSVTAFDADGRAVPVLPDTVAWASSDPTAITVDRSGVALSKVANGSAQISATVGGVLAAPVVALVASVAEGTLLVEDTAIDVDSAELVPIADAEADEDGLPDLSIVLVLSGAPSIGDVVLGIGDIPFSGRIVSTEPAGDGRFRVQVAPVGVEEVLPDLTVDERVDLSEELGGAQEVNPGITEVTVDPGAAQPAAGARRQAAASARTTSGRAKLAAVAPGFAGEPVTVFQRGPLKCEMEGTGLTAPPFQLTVDKPLKLNLVEPEVVVEYRDGDLRRLAVETSGDVTVQGSIKFNAQVDVKLQCKVSAKGVIDILRKIPGLRSLLNADVDFGKAFSVEEKVIGPGLTAVAGAKFDFKGSWGWERKPGGQLGLIEDGLVSNAQPITRFGPTDTNINGLNFRVEGAAEGFVFADFKAAPGSLSGPIGDRIFNNAAGEAKTTMAGGKLGIRFQMNIDDLDDELANPAFKSTYEYVVGPQFKIGVNKTIRTFLRMMGLRELVLLESKALEPLFVSPRSATLDVTDIERDGGSQTHPDFAEDRVFGADVVRLRARVRQGIFFINLVDTPLPQTPTPTPNIDELQVVTLNPDGTVRVLATEDISFVQPPIDVDRLPDLEYLVDFTVTGYDGDVDQLFLVAKTVFPARMATPLGPVFEDPDDGLDLPGFRMELTHAAFGERPPTAEFAIEKESESGDGDRTVLVDGTASSDPDGQVVSWLWDFGDGTAPEETVEPTTTHTYEQDGDYTITLTVTDDDGHTAQVTRAISIIHLEPVGGDLVAAGQVHTCVVLDSSAVKCWGLGGVLGYGTTETVGDDETPAEVDPVPVGAPVEAVTAGDFHTCVLTSAGSVRCWGGINVLGYGTNQPIGDDETPASAGDVPLGGDVAQIDAGGSHTCALLTSGAVRCWGQGQAGQLGYGNTANIGDDETPESVGDVPLGGPAIAVSAGTAHSCAVMSDGDVRCWGAADNGRLGYGNGLEENIGDDETPASAGDIPLGGPAVAVSAGGSHTCALMATGAVRCWGHAAQGKLGYGSAVTGDIGDDETPASAGDVAVGGPVAEISAASQSTCALLVGGTVRCWGDRESGLGYGDAEEFGNPAPIGDDETPASVGVLQLGGPVVDLDAGVREHSCAVISTGGVRCWGSNSFGQLGLGDPSGPVIGDDETPASVNEIALGGTVGSGRPVR